MYKKVPTDLNFVDREHETLNFWKENKIFEKSMEQRQDCPSYTLKGCNVPRKAGWDTHGLPVELEVEKQLGINGKEQIEEYGIAPFIEKCKESVYILGGKSGKKCKYKRGGGRNQKLYSRY